MTSLADPSYQRWRYDRRSGFACRGSHRRRIWRDMTRSRIIVHERVRLTRKRTIRLVDDKCCINSDVLSLRKSCYEYGYVSDLSSRSEHECCHQGAPRYRDRRSKRHQPHRIHFLVRFSLPLAFFALHFLQSHPKSQMQHLDPPFATATDRKGLHALIIAIDVFVGRESSLRGCRLLD